MKTYRIVDDGRALECDTCRCTTHHPDDVYFRYCPNCGMLGPEVRRRWSGANRRELRWLCDQLGRHKRVVDHRGRAFRVPTEAIITEGIREDDLAGRYPFWED